MGTHNAKLNYQFPMAWGQAAAAKEERHSSEETIVSNTSDKTLSYEYSQSERDDYDKELCVLGDRINYAEDRLPNLSAR